MLFFSTVYAGPLADAPRLSAIIGQAVTTLLTIVAGLAVLMILIGGVLYVTAAGDSSRMDLAKKTVEGSVVGLTIAIVSLVIVQAVAKLV